MSSIVRRTHISSLGIRTFILLYTLFQLALLLLHCYVSRLLFAPLVFTSTASVIPLSCNTPQYTLELRASDSLHEGNTTVKIRIKDINDLPPKFDEASYETTILEEDTVGIPKRILKVVSRQVTQLTQLT